MAEVTLGPCVSISMLGVDLFSLRGRHSRDDESFADCCGQRRRSVMLKAGLERPSCHVVRRVREIPDFHSVRDL